jgi:hypothetical protein
MFQRYPTSGKQPQQQERPQPPSAVLNAVKLMYAGAAVSTVYLIVSLATVGNLKGDIRRAQPKLTTSQVNSLATFLIVSTIVLGLIGIGLWLWMSWANREGKNWARITSTVLFVLYTIETISTFAQTKAILALIFPLVAWLIGLGAVALLWRPESTAYFKTPRV